MDDCLFCKIIDGEIPSTKVYEDEYVFAFRDINPQMPTHVLVVPKEHIASVAELNPDNSVTVEDDGRGIPVMRRNVWKLLQRLRNRRDLITVTVSFPISVMMPVRPYTICTSIFLAVDGWQTECHDILKSADFFQRTFFNHKIMINCVHIKKLRFVSWPRTKHRFNMVMLKKS